MNKQERKLRKLKSVELMELQNVEVWRKNDVYSEISAFEWVELI